MAGNFSPACAKNGSWWAKCVRKDDKDSSGNVLPGEWKEGETWCWLSEDAHQDKRLGCSEGDDPPTTEVGDDGYLVGYSCFAHTTNAAMDLDRFEHGGCLTDNEEWKYDWTVAQAGQYKIITPCPKDDPEYPNCA